MDQDTRVPVIIIYGDRRHVFFKPQKYDTLIQLARSYFCIPRGKTLAVSTAPAEYDAMPIAYIYFALGEQTVDRIGRHMVADIYGPPPPVPSTASTEEEVWKNLPWKDWEEVRGMLVMTYQSPNETLVVISNTGRRYKLRVHNAYSATIMRWLVACIEDWEAYKFKILTSSHREELTEDKTLAEHGLTDGEGLLIHAKVFGSPGDWGKGRYQGPFAYVPPEMDLLVPDYPVYGFYPGHPFWKD